MELELPRPILESSWDGDKNLEFQVIDWFVQEDDRVPKMKEYKDRYGVDYPDEPPSYEVLMFGATNEGHSVCVAVEKFEPSFYVRLPEKDWEGKSDSHIHKKILEHKEHLMNGKYMSTFKGVSSRRDVIPRKLKSHLVYVKKIMRKDFWGFNNGEEFPFVKIKVKSLALFNCLKWYYMRELVKQGYKLYESNINPLLRFMHERKVNPCGWVRLNAGTYTVIEEDGDEMPMSRCQINAKVEFTDVHMMKRDQIAPLLIASFDIECTSSHGDFPVPKKKYLKLAQDMVAFTKVNGVPTDEAIYSMIMDAFHETKEYGTPTVTVHQVFTKKLQNPGRLHVLVEAIVPKLTLWLRKVPNEVDDPIDEEKIDADAEDDGEAGAKPAVKSLVELEIKAIMDKGLPELKGDPLIQIGTTVHRYGSDEIIYKHIVTLNSCDPIDGVIVESYETEEDVILAWKDFIARLEPDILIGYNIFGFDMDYIWKRAEEVDCVDDLSIGLGRLCTRRTWLAEQQLASSALGMNVMRFIDLDGLVSIDMYKVLQRDQKLDSYKLDAVAELFLGDRKNDLKPNEIFEKFKGTSADRCEIAKYCIQDCALVNRLFHKLKVLENNVGMGNVCSVPLSYLFMRGQGVKIFSLVAKFCRSLRMLIPVLRSFNEETIDNEVGYEGAIVLPPKVGIYLEDPITVFDFASLYPSSMIERDLSHDRILLNPEKYGNLADSGVTYVTVTYDEYTGIGDKKVVSGKKEVVFAQLPNNKKGVIPSILMELLKQRKNTRKKIDYETLTTKEGSQHTGLISFGPNGYTVSDIETGKETTVSEDDLDVRSPSYNPFEVAVLDALQVAYKVTANSLYGQIGSRTSPIYLKEIAACTTATGRERIMQAKAFMEDNYQAEVIYGDTDSIFCKFPCKDEHGFIVKGKEALPYAIKAGQIGSKAIKPFLPAPQCLEYEKTLFPFIIFSKKRYVGNLYEDDATKKPKQKSMGIVLKRRDNAPIVKKIYGGLIDCLLNQYSLSASVEFLKKYLTDIVSGSIPLEDLIITKTLGGHYKDPLKIAHRVLADRMALRDPGNKPQVNDRIPYIYFVPSTGTEIQLQGDRIEHPDFIREKNLVPDYRFYITNQIMKPVCQIYGLCVEHLPGYDSVQEYWDQVEELLKKKATYQTDEKKRKDKISNLRIEMAEEILFGDALEKLPNIVIKKKPTGKGAGKGRTTSTGLGKGKQGIGSASSFFNPSLTIRLIGKENKEKKTYEGGATIHTMTDDQKLWANEKIVKKGKKKGDMGSIIVFLVTLCEEAISQIAKNPEWLAMVRETGIIITTNVNAFRLNLIKSLKQYENHAEDLEKAIESTNMEQFKDLQELHKYHNIAGALVGVVYKITTTSPMPPATGHVLDMAEE